jgi:hypothetical protein
VDFHTPFMIMIGLFEFSSIGPVATFHPSPSLDLIGFILMHNVIPQRRALDSRAFLFSIGQFQMKAMQKSVEYRGK